MNNLLTLKGTFEQAKSTNKVGMPNLPRGKSVGVEKLAKLRSDLMELKEFWLNETIIPGALISVYYNKVAAKSNRISGLLKTDSNTSNSSIVGVRFSDNESPKHIITHYIPIKTIDDSISLLNICIEILNKEFDGFISYEIIELIKSKERKFNPKGIARTNFLQIIKDVYYVDKFDVLVDEINFSNEAIITIYNTHIQVKELMDKVGFNLNRNRIFDDTTILLRPDEVSKLKEKAPYLISMAVTDITKLTDINFDFCKSDTVTIPKPQTEPVVGVIDTLFDEDVYFSEWVEYIKKIPDDIPVTSSDYHHGTAVTSIIVDGPTSNPNLDDGCGRFKVRHFGVAAGSQYSSFSIIRDIREIVSTNKDIKVWNLSLGSKLEINKNFISPEASMLDKIQYENDVIFIIAGTNKPSTESQVKALGAPADSLNSVVVNSVDFDNTPASYTRTGPVLSFFTKPDISYYGGNGNNRIRVCTSTGEAFVRGTSFAAPWIARKMAYMINILGFSREVAKALLINSATGWQEQKIDSTLIGHGIVPKTIQDIVSSPNDEIQFTLSGISEKYDTYNYNIPVPVVKETQPFIAKATLCYFPCCERNQGVDYTNTELDLQFGRLNGRKIKPINSNYQSAIDEHFTWEEDARKYYRKWDNVKHIREIIKTRKVPKKCYGQGLWGISLKTKERLDEKYGLNIKFGIVITLKEINGVNRIEDFIKNCSLRGWLVNKINVESMLDVYNIAEEEIELD